MNRHPGRRDGSAVARPESGLEIRVRPWRSDRSASAAPRNDGDTMFEVSNQPPPLEPYNLFASDVVLREAVKREGAAWGEGPHSTRSGRRSVRPETIALGFDANRNPPASSSFDRFGHRIDEVEFHPAWHELLTIALRGRPAFEPLGRAQARRACGARRRLLHAQPDRERRLLPGRHDLRLGADAAAGAEDRRRMAAEGPRARATTRVSSRSAKRPAR